MHVLVEPQPGYGVLDDNAFAVIGIGAQLQGVEPVACSPAPAKLQFIAPAVIVGLSAVNPFFQIEQIEEKTPWIEGINGNSVHQRIFTGFFFADACHYLKGMAAVKLVSDVVPFSVCGHGRRWERIDPDSAGCTNNPLNVKIIERCVGIDPDPAGNRSFLVKRRGDRQRRCGILDLGPSGEEEGFVVAAVGKGPGRPFRVVSLKKCGQGLVIALGGDLQTVLRRFG